MLSKCFNHQIEFFSILGEKFTTTTTPSR